VCAPRTALLITLKEAADREFLTCAPHPQAWRRGGPQSRDTRRARAAGGGRVIGVGGAFFLGLRAGRSTPGFHMADFQPLWVKRRGRRLGA